MALPEGFADYLALQDQRRMELAATMAGNLTERELLLVKEAAVMGFVQGAQVGPFTREWYAAQGNDRGVLVRVLQACQSMPDLYPTIANLDGVDRTEDDDDDGAEAEG